MTTKKTDLSKTYITIAIIVGVSIIVYGLIGYISKAQEKKQEANEERLKQLNYEGCMGKIFNETSASWNELCVKYGKEVECSLPKEMSDSIGVRKRNGEQDCLYRFGK